MKSLPITLLFLTTTKGHFGRRTDWKLTLDDIDRQLPLAHFGGKVASLKVSSGDERLGTEMAAELAARGFKVITTNADWSRGASHQIGYNEDLIRLSRHPEVHANPFVWWVEDDGITRVHDGSLERLLSDSMRLLATEPNLLTVRLRRRADDRGPTVCDLSVPSDPRMFFSGDFNFQPAVLRSRDFQLAALCVERNPRAQATVQIEALWRHVLDSFSRSLLRHAVWECDVAESIHIGVPQPEYEAALRDLAITP